jgi:hypothetical protein
VVEPDSEELTTKELINKFKEKLENTDISRRFKKILERRIFLVERFIDKDRSRLAKITLNSMKRLINRQVNRGIDQEDAEMLLNIIDEIKEKL